jgi:hypothetical protein
MWIRSNAASWLSTPPHSTEECHFPFRAYGLPVIDGVITSKGGDPYPIIHRDTERVKARGPLSEESNGGFKECVTFPALAGFKSLNAVPSEDFYDFANAWIEPGDFNGCRFKRNRKGLRGNIDDFKSTLFGLCFTGRSFLYRHLYTFLSVIQG